MSTEQNKELVRRFQAAFNSNNLDALDDVVAANINSHSLFPGLPPGLEGGKISHRGLVAAFPDLHTEIEDLVAEGDKVVMRFTTTGTHKGEFQGAPPTGRSYSTPGMSVFRIANGKIVEHWGVIDTMSVMVQLGLVPMPGM